MAHGQQLAASLTGQMPESSLLLGSTKASNSPLELDYPLHQIIGQVMRAQTEHASINLLTIH